MESVIENKSAALPRDEEKISIVIELEPAVKKANLNLTQTKLMNQLKEFGFSNENAYFLLK